MRMKEDDDALQASIKMLERTSKGVECSELEAITFQGIQADQDGNWHAGAIATLIDGLGALTVNSFTGKSKASVDLTISLYSSAKIQEEVEIEAKVVGSRGKLTSVLVEVKRKGNGELIALGAAILSI
ncbi:hypothetical protein WN944_016929 [Citrus x changshan-huyou]|uniref:Thioesterase domain-containing protein n=1 Tax=Citrus x changshan-huyou TaxID=2935761 RepID=A0AAP0QKT6_9ROSI